MDNQAIELIQSMTGVSEAQATELLSAYGSVEAAVNSFFEDESGSGDDGPPPLVAAGPPPPAAAPKKAAAVPRGGASNVRSLADLGKRDSDDEEDEKDAPRTSFIGGAKSGQLVQDPKKGGDKVANLFEAARKAGATDGGPLPPPAPPPGGRGPAFTGAAHTLAGGAAPGAAAAAGASAPPAPPAHASHTITFYRNGFTVDGGPLRRMDDPANAPFMEALAAGVSPEELRPADPNTSVHVSLVRRDEDYTEPPQPKHVSFAGEGRTTGGGARGGGATVAPTGWSVDEAAPVTSLQIRLPDGARVVARFNTGHTLAHVRAFIDTLRPGTGAKGALLSGTPPLQLAENGDTLAQAGLIGAVVIQQL